MMCKMERRSGKAIDIGNKIEGHNKMERGAAWYTKSIILLLMIIMLTALCGCSLAVEDSGEEDGMSQDRLIGAYITTEHLDTFDAEAYFEEHADEIITGVENGSISDGDIIGGEAYQERIYATVDKHGSTNPTDWDIYFTDIEGICFFDAVFQNEDEEPFSMIIGDDGICDIHTIFESTDEGEHVEIRGKLYALLTENDSQIFYVNPVYQTPSGEVYMVGGDGNHMSGGLGGVTTIKIEAETTIEENGEKEICSGAVEVAFEILNAAPEKIRVQFMNDNLEIVSTEEFEAGKMPTEMVMAEGASFVIIETQWEDGTVTRDLFEKEEESIYIETFYKISDKMLAKQMTEIMWEQVYDF